MTAARGEGGVMSGATPDVSLRDYIATQALCLLPSGVLPADERATTAAYCYAIADEMLKARGEEPTS